MHFENAAIPVNAAWSSPFVRWQGSLADVNSLELASQVGRDALSRASISPEVFDSVVVGLTIPQREAFYAATTIAARIGAEGATGPVISQACATSVACLHAAAAEVNDSGRSTLVITTDRTSNGPVVTYPSSSATGGAPAVEHWVLDSFKRDPWAGKAMMDTAELVAAENGITRDELDDLTVQRYEQYEEALANDRRFQASWMVPAIVPRGRKDPIVVERDEGIRPATAEGLSNLRPVDPDGVVTFGTQTHPADGTAGMVVTTLAEAAELANGGGVAQILGTGTARVGKARMPEAPVPAARAALDSAGLDLSDIDVVKTHNPFAVNDIYFAKTTGYAAGKMNPFGCSLIYGHPQGPTGARGIVELIAALLERGGGVGLFTGCAAGDSGAAVVIRIDS